MAAFHPGPHQLADVPGQLGQPVGFVTWADARQKRWPSGFLAAARDALARRGGVVLVGRTDPVGPKSLNRSLGFQYSLQTTQALIPELGKEPWRFAYASEGEASPGAPGVAVYPWAPPVPAATKKGRIAILEPSPGLPRGVRLLAAMTPGSGPALFGAEGPDGVHVWEVEDPDAPVSLPLPGQSDRVVLAAARGSRGEDLDWSAPSKPILDPALTLRVEAAESWVARLVGVLPPRCTGGVVWASGIPYPVSPGPGRAANLSVALMPEKNNAYLQVVDPMGRTAVGPLVQLPDGSGDPPEILAVLVWGEGETNLELHGWVGAGHTHSQDPDPQFSPTAAPGARLLFDGDAGGRSSALAYWGGRDISIEARCYSDIGRQGTEAFLFLAERPADPLGRRLRVFGPRRLSEHPLEVRWPVFARGAPAEGERRP